MTPDQELAALRQELAINERVSALILSVAQHMANAELRDTYKTLDAAQMLRQTGIAEGIEKFAQQITKAPKAARNDQSPPR